MRLIFFLILTVVLVGCHHDDSDQNLTAENEKYQNSISLQDEFDQEVSIFNYAETIRVYLSIFLDSDSDEILLFNTSQLYELYITDADGVEVWRQSDITMYLDVVTELELLSRSTMTFRDDLENIHFAGGGLMPGSYTLHGYWIGYGQTASVEFHVQ